MKYENKDVKEKIKKEIQNLSKDTDSEVKERATDLLSKI